MAGLPPEGYRRQRRGGSAGYFALPHRGDLYYDKLGQSVEDDEQNWVAKEMGTQLEDLVARIFAKKTGLAVCPMPVMFQHAEHPWMLADVDRLVTMVDGKTAILECKTTNYNARDKWEYDGKPIVPQYYEAQGRHYMAVMNLDRVYYCCLYGNSEDDVIIRSIDRDPDYEAELIALEENFWTNHVQVKTPPPYIEDDGALVLESLRRCMGPSRKDAPPMVFTEAQSEAVRHYAELRDQKNALSAEVKRMEKELEQLKAGVLLDMGESWRGVYEGTDGKYTVTYTPSRREKILKDSLARLKEDHPDIFKQYATVSESRTFNVKFTAAEAAAQEVAA